MPSATVTSKGQITIPAEIRKAMGLTPGIRVVFTRFPDGSTFIRAKTRSLLDLQGFLKRPGGDAPPVAIEDMNIGAADAGA